MLRTRKTNLRKHRYRKREEKEIETEEGKARKEIASTIDVEAEVVTEIWVGKESETEIMIIREGIWA
ncbi:hypothetical protein Tco_1267896 [Tanacetum coccineum]